MTKSKSPQASLTLEERSVLFKSHLKIAGESGDLSRVAYLKEHNESPYNVLPELVKTKSGMYVTKDKLYPLIFELKAMKT